MASPTAPGTAENAAHTIVLATRQVGAPVVSVLRDWSAVGLIRPFLFIRAEEVSADRTKIAATLIVEGRASRVRLQDHLAGSDTVHQIRVVALDAVSWVSERVSVATAEQVRDALTRAAPRSGLTLARVIAVARGAAGWNARAVAETGWNTAVIAPEDARGPDAAQTPVTTEDSELFRHAHAAAGLAGLAGLWTGTGAAPLDTLPPLPGSQVRLARTYLRRLAGEEVARDLRSAVTAVSGVVPRPRNEAGLLPYLDDPANTAAAAARELLAGHGELLEPRREGGGPAPLERIGLGRLLGAFFSFLLAAFRDAPRRWRALVVGGVSSRVAAGMQRALLGEASSLQVVVNGYTGSGSVAGRAEVEAAVEALLGAVADGPVADDVFDHSALWRDFVGVGLSLVDGAERKELRAGRAGLARGVVPATAAVAPPPSAAFELPDSLAVRLGVRRLSPYDLLEVDAALRRLRQMIEAGESALEAGRVAEELRTWTAEHQRTYSGQVGFGIARVLHERQRELGDIQTKLAEVSEVELDPGDAPERMGRALRRWAYGALAVWAAVGAIAGIGLLSFATAGIIAAGTLLVWFVGSVVTFARGYRELFTDLHRQRSARSELEVLAGNVVNVLREIRRLRVGYTQYLGWAAVLGAFLAEPLGRVRAEVAPAPPLAPGFPRSVGLGHIVAGDDAVARVAADIGTRLFRVGWLEDPFHALLRDAPARLGNAGRVLAQDPGLLWTESGAGPSSLLAPWAEVLRAGGVGRAGADAHWADALRRLAEPDLADARAQLIANVREAAVDTERGVTDAARFRAGLRDAQADSAFDASILVAHERASDACSVDTTDQGDWVDGLSETVQVVQFSRGIQAADIELGAGADRELEIDSPVDLSSIPGGGF